MNRLFKILILNFFLTAICNAQIDENTVSKNNNWRIDNGTNYAKEFVENGVALSNKYYPTNSAHSDFTNLQTQINNETNRAYNVETNLQGQINNETNRAYNAETNIQNNLNVYKTEVGLSTNDIVNKINNETNRAFNAETNIQNNLDVYKTQVELSTNDIINKINNETNRAYNSETNIQTQLNNETNRAYNAETNIQNNLDVYKTQVELSTNDIINIINNETNRAYNSETNIQNNLNVYKTEVDLSTNDIVNKINNETNRAYSSETNLQAQINNETNRAYNVETNLQGQVTTIDTNVYKKTDGTFDFRGKSVLLSNPVDTNEAANKSYVDSQIIASTNAANWAQYPAIQDPDMADKNLTNCGNIYIELSKGISLGGVYQTNWLEFGTSDSTAYRGDWGNSLSNTIINGPILINAESVAVGKSANAAGLGSVVGYGAIGSDYGAVLGYNADGSMAGAAIGMYANGSFEGVAVGDYAKGFNCGVAIGTHAFGTNYAVAVGPFSSAVSNSVAIGYGVANAKPNTTKIKGNLNMAGSDITNVINISVSNLYLSDTNGNPQKAIAMSDPPSDGSTYGRKNGDWINITGVSGPGVVPVGTIMMYGTNTAPAGWLSCDGASVATNTYPALYAVIGGTYGSTNVAWFNVPDMRGVFPKGAGTTSRAAGKDANGNYYSGTLGAYSTDKMQGVKYSVLVQAGTYVYDAAQDTATGAGATHIYGLSTNSNTGGNFVTGNPQTDGANGAPRIGTSTEPQSLGVNFIIKY